MRPLTNDKPKQMIRVLGKPLLEHIVEALPEEIDELVLVVGYKAEQIKNHFGGQFGRFRVRYITQRTKTGTAHALFLCKDALAGERFLLLYGDDLHSEKDIKKCLQHPLAISVYRVKNPREFGVVVINGRNKVISIVEKPRHPVSDLAASGINVLDARIFGYDPRQHLESGEYHLPSMVTQLAKDHEVIAVEAGFWVPIGRPEDIATAEAILRGRNSV